MQDYSLKSQEVVRENRSLRLKLKTLINDARKNETVLRRFQTLELHLLASNSLTDLIQMLLHHGRTIFGWDEVSIVLYDKDHEIRHLYEQLGEKPVRCSQLIFTHTIDQLEGLYGTLRKPILTAYSKQHHKHLFPRGRVFASVALLPLICKDSLMGSLNLGSLDSNRFQNDNATDFLEHLSAVLATCIYTTIAQERLKQTGLTDALTGVNNRRFFDQRLPEEIGRSQRINAPLSCLFIDIDHFKKINDTYGHQTGDNVLRIIANLIRDHLRTSMDVVARYGGEEFAVLLGLSGKTKAMEVAERIRLSVLECDFHEPDLGYGDVTVSIGITTLEQHHTPENAESSLISTADQAMYLAKQHGRNRIIFLDAQTGVQLQKS